VGVGEGGAETGSVLAGAAASMRIGGGGAETGSVLAAVAASVRIGGGGAETGSVLAGAAASVRIGGGGAEMGAVLAAAARSNAGTTGLRESLGGKNILSPAPTAKEKRMIRVAPNGVLTASTKVLAQSDFLLSGRTRTIALSPFSCALISPPVDIRNGIIGSVEEPAKGSIWRSSN